ncbi:MAG TPA: hypothetical protein VF776_07570 [Sphingomicrobium sp.]
MRIAAMMCPIDEGPEFTGRPTFAGIGSEQANAHTEHYPSAKLQRLHLRHPPRKWIQQWQPRIFELRQFLSAYAACQKRTRNRFQPRLRRGLATVQLLQPFAPPCQAYRAKVRVTAGRDDIGERQIQCPQRRKCRPQLPRQLLECDLAVVVEPALSDR